MNAIKISSLAVILGLCSASLPIPSSQAANTKPAGEKTAGEKTKAAEKAAAKPEPVIENVQNVTVDNLVDNPHEYLNKNIHFTANFFAYSSLALDYKPALRSSRSNLSFLVLRPNSHIPLSELKLAMANPKEKDPENQVLLQLKDGDQIDVTGKVFSNAMDEPWVDVLRLKRIAPAAGNEKKEKASLDGDSHKPADKEKEKKASDTKPEIPTIVPSK